MSFTTPSGKRLKIEIEIPRKRVYYSSPFDLYNFCDTLFLQSISKRFENCFLIIGIEDPAGCIMTLTEREESLRQVQCLRQMLCIEQIICPANEIDLNFMQTYKIDYLCVTPDKAGKYEEMNLGEQLVLIDPPVKLSKNDLLARVVANKNKFLVKCLDNGYSRKQLGVSLLEKVSAKIKKFAGSEKWKQVKGNIQKVFVNKGRKFYKKVVRRIQEFELGVSEYLTENFEE